MFRKDSFLRSWLCRCLTTLTLIAGMIVSAAPPDRPLWWSEQDGGGFKVIDSNVADPNPMGLANIGQGKYMAKRALEALSAVVGTNLDLQAQLVTPIQQDLYKSAENSTQGVFYPVRPATPDAAWIEAQKAPLQIGALKALAAPFYRHLSEINADWVKDQLVANGLTLGTSFFVDTDGAYYPWNPADNADSMKNQAPATIGQLKAVFSFRFDTLAAVIDDDFDDDGLTNDQEAILGTDPREDDSDGDGMRDGWEVTWELDPLDPADANCDTDGDHVTNLREFELDSIPSGIYRVEVLPLAANKYFHAAADDGSVLVQSTPVWDNTALELVSAPDAGGNRTILPAPASGWNPLSAILAGLVADGKLNTGDPLNPTGPDSSDQVYRVFGSGDASIILETPGDFVRTLPSVTSWNAINRWGDAITTVERSVPAANGVPAHQVADILISYPYYGGFNETIAMPGEWFPASQMPSIQAFSDDGHVLIRRYVANPDTTSGIATYLLDISSGVFRLVAPAGEIVASLSNENARLVGNGAQPFLVTPDGTRIRLDALRVRSNTGTVIPFGGLYPLAISPNHIASDGRITVTATDSTNQPMILQIVPDHDADRDGIADDWEKDYAARLLAFNSPAIQDPDIRAELLSGNLDPNVDYAGNGADVGTVAGYAANNRGSSGPTPNPTGMRVESQSKGLHGKVYVIKDNNGTRCDGSYTLDGRAWPSDDSQEFDTAPTPEWSKTKAEQRDWISSNPYLTDYYHFGTLSFVENWYSKKIGAAVPPTTMDSYFVKHRKQRLRIWGRDLVAENDVDLKYLKVVEYQNDPNPEQEGLHFQPWTTPRPAGFVVESTEAVTITIPAGRACSDWFELEPPLVDGRDYLVSLLPVEVVELSPKTKDEDGNDIAGSEKPNQGEPLTPFVEVDPHANKIAHRELKVKIGEALKDKKVAWTLEPLPGATPATIRGQWEDSPTHKDRFEASTAYGANGFRKASGETTVGADGHTAIRVNVPPIGFNQVRIRIQIEGVDTPIDLIDMEVPGVVVIDPGHGGIDSGAVGRTDDTVLEKDLALAYSLKLREELIDKFKEEERGIRIVMTRNTTNGFLDKPARAQLANNQGADVFVSIHFNSSSSNSSRGTEALIERNINEIDEDSEPPYPGDNVNQAEDALLAEAISSSAFGAVQSQDLGAVQRRLLKRGKVVTFDDYYGNTQEYHPVKGCLIEVEFLSNETALESVKLPGKTGEAIKDAFAEDAAADIFNNVLNQP